jgi:hypothetical protein
VLKDWAFVDKYKNMEYKAMDIIRVFLISTLDAKIEKIILNIIKPRKLAVNNIPDLSIGMLKLFEMGIKSVESIVRPIANVKRLDREAIVKPNLFFISNPPYDILQI